MKKNRTMAGIALSTALATVLLAATPSPGAMPMTLRIEGQVQGPIEGDMTEPGKEGLILVHGFNHEINVPFDAASGGVTGRRRHEPLRILKEVDRSTPLLYQALAMNEVLDPVILRFYRIDPGGGEEHFFTITLENARIIGMRQWMPNELDPATQTYRHMEEVSFTYQRINWRDEVNQIEFQDDWTIRAE